MKFKSGMEKTSYLKSVLLKVLKTMGYLTVADYKRICHHYPIEAKDYVIGWRSLYDAHFTTNEYPDDANMVKLYIAKQPSILASSRAKQVDFVGNIPSLGNVHIVDNGIQNILIIHLGLASNDLEQWRHHNRKILVFDNEPMKQNFILWFDNHQTKPGEDVIMVGKDFDLKPILREHGLIVREVI